MNEDAMQAQTSSKMTSPAWVITVLIVILTPVALVIAAIPTMDQGGSLKNTAVLISIVGGIAVLVLSISARLIWRRSPSARKRVPVIALLAAVVVAVIAAGFMWTSGQ